MKKFATVLLCVCLLAMPVSAEETPTMPDSIEGLWGLYLELLEKYNELESRAVFHDIKPRYRKAVKNRPRVSQPGAVKERRCEESEKNKEKSQSHTRTL